MRIAGALPFLERHAPALAPWLKKWFVDESRRHTVRQDNDTNAAAEQRERLLAGLE